MFLLWFATASRALAAKYAEIHLQRETSGVLLKPATFRKLHTPAPGEDYAGGWGCHPRPWAKGLALTHSGSNTMWYVVLWLAPARDFAVIVATNTGAGDTAKGCDDVTAAMIKKWISPAPGKWRAPPREFGPRPRGAGSNYAFGL